MKRLMQILSSSLCILLLSIGLNAQESTNAIPPDNLLIDEVHLSKNLAGIDLDAFFNIGFDLQKLRYLQPQQKNNTETLNYIYFPDTVTVYSTAQNPKNYTYTYSGAGNRLSSTTKVLQNEVWVNQFMESSSFDQVNNRLSSVLKFWQNGAWVNTGKKTYTYATNNKILTAISEYWNGSAWIKLERYTYSYNTSDKMVSFLKETWFGDTWNNVSYALYTYSTFGNLISGTTQRWEGNTWNNYQQYTYAYDANNNMLSGLYKIWDVNEWANSYLVSYTYDAFNQPVLVIGKEWINNNWVNNNKFVYTYNQYGFITLVVRQDWLNNSWKNSLRGTYTPNYYGGLQTALIENWVSNAWVNVSLSTYSHDENGNTSTADLYGWNGETWVSYDDDFELTYNNNILSDTYLGYHAKASYISFINVHELANESIMSLKAIPNPSKGLLSIHIATAGESNAELCIYNLSGNKVYTAYPTWLNRGENRIDINIQGLSNGIYIAKLSTLNTDQILKIVIAK